VLKQNTYAKHVERSGFLAGDRYDYYLLYTLFTLETPGNVVFKTSRVLIVEKNCSMDIRMQGVLEMIKTLADCTACPCMKICDAYMHVNIGWEHKKGVDPCELTFAGSEN